MRNILFAFLLISTSFYAQNYEKNWNTIIENENNGKIKSANAIVAKIHKKAVADKNEVQIIKCFFYESKYLQVVDENAQTKIINNLKTEINRASIPSKAILNLVYAKCLSDYFNKNRYSIQNRTLIDSTSSNFLTWTKADFEKQIQIAYEKTLENEAILIKTQLINYEPVFDFLTLEKFKEQNLFEYLLKENINYCISKTGQWYVNPKEYDVYSKSLLGNSTEFTSLNLEFMKIINLKSVLQLYQKKEANNPSLENQFERILFCSNTIVKSDDAFLESLNAIQKNTKDELLLQKIQFEKANIFAKLASKEIYSDYNIKAISILDSVVNVKNHSNAYKLAVQKKQQIKSKTSQIQLEKFTYVNENTRAFVKYKNVDNLKISFFKINQKMVINFENRILKKDSLLAIVISKGKALQSNKHQFINKKDYFEYTTEVLLPQLETGSYLAYFESDGDEKNGKAFSYQTITVSDLTVLAQHKYKEEYYQVLNRKTGKPMENINIKSPKFNIKTNSEGLAVYKKENENSQYEYETIELSNTSDTLRIAKNYISYTEDYSDKEDVFFNAKAEFYLDRAIYRPGQTVYYKGIVVQKKKDKSSVVPNLPVKIIIEDADHNDFKEFEVTTNEFGSFSGEFVLPKNGLTGQFRIEAEEPDDTEKDPLYNKEEEEHPFWDNVDFDDSSISFRVEEYKRPKFEVTFEPVKESYVVNQKINVTGKAKAFAGSNISDAKVVYTITRITYNSYRTYYPDKLETLTTGETRTDASGKFTIEFQAKPTENLNQKELPYFSYKIKADITDINGETHSNETTIKVGYHSLVLIASLPTKIETKDKNTIELTSNNLNGQFVPTKGTMKIYCIREFSNKFKARVWEKPEVEGISDTDFERLFPYEKNEKTVAESETGTLIYSKKVDTQKDKTIPMDFISDYKSGHYKLEFLATDTFDNPIKTSTVFYITQSKNVVNSSKLFTIKQLNEDPKKDGFISLKITSNIPELYINTTGNYQGKVYFEQNNVLKNNQVLFKIPLEKEFKNALKIGFESVFENQIFYEELEVLLKTQEPKMKFEVETFKNKIEPGTKENWSFKLSSSTSSTQAEVLASMYDSSLDQFTTKNWSSLQVNQNVYNYINRKTSLGFDKIHSQLGNLNSYSGRIKLHNEDTKLMWFGFNFNESDNPTALKEYQKEKTKKSSKPLNAKTITGIVSDESGPLPGVNITIKGTQRGIQTDFDGYYEIEAAIGEELTFSYIGFENQNIAINSNVIDVQLVESSNSLQEVVVVGYGSQKKSSLTGSVQAQVEEDNNVYNYSGIEMTLNGKVSGVTIRGISSIENAANALYIADGVPITEEQMKSISPSDIIAVDVLKGEKATALYGSKGANGVIIITTKKALEVLTQVKARKNLSETAFFYPNLKTDAKGKVSFNFTSPEALTAWKLRLLVHNKDAVSGYLEKSVITQKELMVTPNFPRFFREKDSIIITAKVVNVTNEAKIGIAVLQLFDATTMQTIDAKMANTNTIKNFNIAAYGNTIVSWKIYIPEGLQGVQYKVLAKAGTFSDGEENILPVLTNNMLVTESIPIWVRENSKKEYTFENLKNNTSTTLRNHQFTLEYTSNPSWIAIQSLPYLMEYEHECAEQTFARFYANALASEIISSNPKIASLFETWRKNEKLNSKLEENEELRSMILAETPWLNDAQNEDEKKKNLALLFDLEKMKTSQETTFDKLKQKQKLSGGFAWFDGSNENEYITRHILAGLGHLSKLSNNEDNAAKIKQIAATGIPFLDQKFLQYRKARTLNLKTTDKFIWFNPYSDLHYLYTRSFYLNNYPLSDTLKKTAKLYIETAKKDWLSYSLYEKGLAALTLNRFGEKEAAKKIIESLKETASNNEDWGMYWIANKAGWYWHQAPIETQTLLIEAFAEVENDTKSVDAMKVWLLKNKQTKNWPTTKSTTEAIYALLMQGTDWLSVKDNTIINIGADKILTKKLSENEKEAETGYVKLNWKADEIKKEMATISIENKSKVPGFGGVYWQYFEDLDKIKNNSGAVLSVSKELYLKKNTDKGEKLERITSNNPLQLGGLVTVRLVISAKEDMEFVHLKDIRASCFEPVNVLSEYQYKDRLGFYQSTKDAATHFFFDYINKGTYVLEYDIRVNNLGNFSNGISTIESMYAPEFTSHTKGIRVNVKE
jgi:TonB-dependent SusC/RagA subfamily outer membrane receptor